MVRMVQRGDNIAVARQLHVGGGVALVITEGAVGENDQREALAPGRIGRIVEVHRHLAEAAVLLKGVCPGAVDQDGGAFPDLILPGYRQAVVIGKEESRDEKQTEEQNAKHA